MNVIASPGWATALERGLPERLVRRAIWCFKKQHKTKQQIASSPFAHASLMTRNDGAMKEEETHKERKE